jgi:cytochrome c oxidase cbb3-type subunit 3
MSIETTAATANQPTATWHEVDGIIEHDNKLPNWWLMTLFAAIAFAIAYWLVYHLFGALPLVRETYRADLIAHQARQAQIAATRPLDDAMLASLVADDGAIARGKATFASTCAACHGQNGEGLVGPNLTDNAWLHGGAPMAIYGVVQTGVLAKGMPAWGATLGDSGTKDVVAFVLSLKGKHLSGKAPEGSPEG